MMLPFPADCAHYAAPIVIAGLWQGLAVALVLTFGLRLARRSSGAQRFAVWYGGLIAAAALPLVPLFFEGHFTAGSSMGLGTAGAAHAWLRLDARWMLVVAGLWLTASVARGADLVVHMVRLYHLWRTAGPIEVETLPDLNRRRFEVCATKELDRPSVIGFFRPRVLIPEWLLPRLTEDELRQIVLHEATHLARRDDWSNLFQKLCLVVFPLNPGLVWIDWQLGKEREIACDEAVVRVTQAPRAYAACLTSLAERGMMHRREALSLGAWQRRSELATRVHRILRAHKALSPAKAGAMLGAFGCSLLVLTFELARCPQLVAFVPAAQATAVSSAQLGDAVLPDRSRLTPGARLIETRAVLPAASIAKPLTSRAHRKARAVGELRAAASEPGNINIRAVELRQREKSAALTDRPQQLIVLTTWEQVETMPAGSQQAIADYDAQAAAKDGSSTPVASTAPGSAPRSSAPGDGQSGQAGSSEAAPGAIQHRATMTQLILRIVPSNSNSSQPIAIPLGWFVIQL